MTIIVAFVLEAFLFRMEYSKEHPDNEGGELPCLQSKMLNILYSLSQVPVVQRADSSIQ